MIKIDDIVNGFEEQCEEPISEQEIQLRDWVRNALTDFEKEITDIYKNRIESLKFKINALQVQLGEMEKEVDRINEL